MNLRFMCRFCRTILTVAFSMVGKVVRCPHCGHTLQVPVPASPPTVTEPPPPPPPPRPNLPPLLLWLGGLAALLLICGLVALVAFLSSRPNDRKPPPETAGGAKSGGAAHVNSHPQGSSQPPPAPPTDFTEISGHRGEIICLAFSPDGTKLASCDFTGLVLLTDLRSGKQTELAPTIPNPLKNGGRPIRVPGSVSEVLAFSPDGDRLAWCDCRSNVRLHDVVNDRPLPLRIQLSSNPAGWFYSHQDVFYLRFSPGGQTLVTTDLIKGMRHWSAATGNLERQVDWMASPLSADGQTAALHPFASDSWWLIETTRPLKEQQNCPRIPAPKGRLLPPRFASRSRTLVVSSSDTRVAGAITVPVERYIIEVFDLQSAQAAPRIHGTDDERMLPFGAVPSPDGRLVAAYAGRSLKVWQSRTGALLAERRPDIVRFDTATTLTFSPDGKLVAAGWKNGRITFWRPDLAAPSFKALYFYIYYETADRAFERAARTAVEEDRERYQERVGPDGFTPLLLKVRTTLDFTLAWEEVQKAARQPGSRVFRGRVFTHASKQTDGKDGLEFTPFITGATFTSDRIASLARLNWHPSEGLLILHGCNTGVRQNRTRCPAEVFAQAQQVLVHGQAGYSNFSCDPLVHSTLEPSSPRAYLWAYNYGKNARLRIGDGKRLASVEFAARATSP